MKRFKNFFIVKRHTGTRNVLTNLAKLLLIWCPVVSLLFVIALGDLENWRSLPIRFAISTVISMVVAAFCYLGSTVIFQLDGLRRFRKGLAPREESFLWGVVFSIPFMLPGLFFGFKVAVPLSKQLGGKFEAPQFSDYSSGVLFGILVSAFFALFETLYEYRTVKKDAAHRVQLLENENLKAKISALSAQLNPHVLFNALNTVAATISTNPQAAEEMVLQLSELYRAILLSAKESSHTLESELAVCRSYLSIEQMRFGERIKYSFQIADDVSPEKIEIPILMVQPLIENAVKHGVTPKRDGGHIQISARRLGDQLQIQVSDTGILQDSQLSYNKGTGTGLQNCESRLKLRFGPLAHFDFAQNKANADNSATTTVTIRLPFNEICRG